MINWKDNYWQKPIKSKRLFDNPVLVREHPVFKGDQRIYRFANNYGASLVRWKYPSFIENIPPARGGYGSYTLNENQWELALIRFPKKTNDDFAIVYDMPFDVVGYLSEDEVEKYLKKIKSF